jgi:hypothetical protein
MKWYIYEGHAGKESWALKAPDPDNDDYKATLLVFDPETGASTVVKDVPVRAEGGGHTFRPVA